MRTTKAELRQRRKRRIRARISSGSTRPRLTIYCSLLRVYAQIIDDSSGKTIVSVASKSGEKNAKAAAKVGEAIAKKAKDAKVLTVVFDRNGRKYHGRLKALADAARAGGLQF